MISFETTLLNHRAIIYHLPFRMSSKISDRSGKIREYETPPSFLSQNQEENFGFQEPENTNYIRERAERQAKQNLIFTGKVDHI